MPHPTPYPKCIFCGRKANSREHAIPKWISKQLNIKEFLPLETAIEHGVTRRKQPISFGGYRARIFCSKCNRHFKHLEDHALRLIVPMARGRVLSLGEDSQSLLALWAAKTAAAVLAAVPELREVVPVDHRLSIREDGRPCDKTWIAYFPWRGGPVLGTTGGVAVRDQDPSVGHETYSAFLTFAQLAFYVIGFASGPGPDEAIGWSRPPVVQFWPLIHRRIDWPPGERVTNRIFPSLLGLVPLRRVEDPESNEPGEPYTEIDHV